MFSSQGPGQPWVHKRSPSSELLGPGKGIPNVVLIEGIADKAFDASTSVPTRTFSISLIVVSVALLGIIIGFGVNAGNTNSRQNQQQIQLNQQQVIIDQLIVNNTQLQQQLAEILMHLPGANATLRNNGTMMWSGFSDFYGVCGPIVPGNYSVYDVTVDGLLPFVVIYLYPPESPAVYSDASCGGTNTNAMFIGANEFDPVIPEVIRFNMYPSYPLLSTYNLNILPYCGAGTCRPPYIVTTGQQFVQTNALTFEYFTQFGYDTLNPPIVWTFNPDTPLRVVFSYQ